MLGRASRTTSGGLWARFDAELVGGASEDDIDPSDMPEELQAANIAYRAVLNGYGQPGETFRNRLVAYLGERFRFSDEAVKRIATVFADQKSCMSICIG